MHYFSYSVVIVLCLGAYTQMVTAADIGNGFDDQVFLVDERVTVTLEPQLAGDVIIFAPEGYVGGSDLRLGDVQR